MKLNVPKDYRPLIRAAVRAGWSVEQRGHSGRVIVRPPRGPQIVLASTPSAGKRALQNARAALRRAGLKV